MREAQLFRRESPLFPKVRSDYAILQVDTFCIYTMQFEWDENKNAQNLKKHGISFEEAQEIFDGIVFNAIDERFDYGEIREISIGAIQGVVIVTPCAY